MPDGFGIPDNEGLAIPGIGNHLIVPLTTAESKTRANPAEININVAKKSRRLCAGPFLLASIPQVKNIPYKAIVRDNKSTLSHAILAWKG